jgi:hypothetical protein
MKPAMLHSMRVPFLQYLWRSNCVYLFMIEVMEARTMIGVVHKYLYIVIVYLRQTRAK